ncbi:MAG: hypothetical protein IPL58_01865 [Betaproteobacteria bacterium]|uniref:Uncharacterized protein n=1 Tax=Candidatus Proximibacter danicus TaxID=2954365 RepID=A0A9D7K087_9PROT|nr:hypothetical protein [Candidatus Proximibacter danicus]
MACWKHRARPAFRFTAATSRIQRGKLELTFGKIDIFGFFDLNWQPPATNQKQDLNSVFVRAPPSTGGEVAVVAGNWPLHRRLRQQTNLTEPFTSVASSAYSVPAWTGRRFLKLQFTAGHAAGLKNG